MPYTIIFDNEFQDSSIQNVVDCLLTWSKQGFLQKPNDCLPIQSSQEILAVVPQWPFWHSRPWIVCGTIESDLSKEHYNGPFIKNGSDKGYDEQCNALMSSFDWAVFSYFTTFSDDNYCFITRSKELFQRLKAHPPKEAFIETYDSNTTQSNSLRNATFSDYGQEGELPYLLALENDEVPFLLCRIDGSDPEIYQWDTESQSYSSSAWYEEYIARLDLVEQFSVVNSHGITTDYQLYLAKDYMAYKAIWSMASDDASIADATLSSNCDIKQLRIALRASDYFFDVIKQTSKFSPWAYTQFYGGGSDEHYGHFRSSDADLTNMIWELVSHSNDERVYPASRF